MKFTGNIVDIINRSIYPEILFIENGRIIHIQIDNNNYDNFIMPSFIDAHIHIESSMLVPSGFVLPLLLTQKMRLILKGQAWIPEKPLS